MATISARRSCTVTVNYNLTVEEMVKAGEYASSNREINSKNFRAAAAARSRIKVQIELVHFDRYMESDEVLRELDRLGLRPATLVELLALGEQHRAVQTKFPIAALGSVLRNWGGGRGVVYLLSNGGHRRLNLTWFERKWCDSCRFAAIHR